MTTTSEKILESIKKEHIQPAPRWKFLARNSVLWMMFAIALLIGALSFSVIVNLLANHDWDIYRYLHKTFLQYLVLSLPYLWIVCLALFSWIAYYNFVHTKGWYHHSVYLIVSISIFLSVALGVVLFCMGIGDAIDRVMSANVPYYELMKMNKKDLWNHPADGLLWGKVIDIRNANEFTIDDCCGKQWDVQKEAADIKSSGIKIGEDVKIIGKEKDSKTFEAQEVRDWDPRNKKSSKDTNADSQGGSNNNNKDQTLLYIHGIKNSSVAVRHQYID